MVYAVRTVWKINIYLTFSWLVQKIYGEKIKYIRVAGLKLSDKNCMHFSYFFL